MRIALIAKPGHQDTGVGKYASQLGKALQAQGHDIFWVYPKVPLPSRLASLIHRWFGWDLAAFFQNYPVWTRYPRADIYHITSQNLATLMLFRRPPGPTVITVHDIIPWLVREDPELCVYKHRFDKWFDWLALAGLGRANALIADSEFTRRSLQQVDVTTDVATVITLGVM